MSNVTFDKETGLWMRPGSNKLYKSEAAAQKAYERSETARKRFYNRYIKIAQETIVTYGNIYAKGVVTSDEINYMANTAGGGFYRAFSPVWDDYDGDPDSSSAGRMLWDLLQEAKTDVGILALLRRMLTSPAVSNEVKATIRALISYEG